MLFWGRYGESSDREHFLGMMTFNKIIRILEHPPIADKSAPTDVQVILLICIFPKEMVSVSALAAQQLLLLLRISSSGRERYTRSAS